MYFEVLSEELGTLRISPEQVQACAPLGLTMRFRARETLRPGACLRLQLPLACPAPQFDSPLKAGFTVCACETGSFALSRTRTGHPADAAYVSRFGHSIYLTLTAGFAGPETDVTLRYGEAASGFSAPFGDREVTRAPFFTGAHPVTFALDARGDRAAPYSGMLRSAKECTLRVTPGPGRLPHAARCARGVITWTEDEWGNPADAPTCCTDAPCPSPKQPGGELPVFFADLHCHSRYSDGLGSPEDCYRFARDYAGLDVCALTDHARYVSDAEWLDTQHTAARFNEPGRFVTLLGYECSHPISGEKNLYFPGDTGTLLRELDLTDDRVTPIADMAPVWQQEGAMMMAHLHSGHLAAFHDDSLCRLMEMYSNLGCCERAGAAPTFFPALRGRMDGQYAQDALALGFRVGFTGGSDDHMGRPGISGWHRVERTYRGGLTGIYAPALTRESIFAALHARHTFATTGARMLLYLRTPSGALPGDALAAGMPFAFAAQVLGCGPLTQLELVHGSQVEWSLSPAGESAWQGAIPCSGAPGAWYLRVTQADGHQGFTSPFYLG